MATDPYLEEFFFRTPLYESYEPDCDIQNLALSVEIEPVTLDGHCPYCSQPSVFRWGGFFWEPKLQSRKSFWEAVHEGTANLEIAITCQRDETHVLKFWLNCGNHKWTKVGQDPSLANIANDASKAYRSVLSTEDSRELYKAIGLAAHGVGIGSFVYLRRIFERLIKGRFDTFKAEEGWSDSDFNKLRMDDKVEFLKDHLPSFLVENKRIYSILSVGLHELSEQNCLGFFGVLEKSIFIILEEDKKKKEELELRRAAEKAIAKFQPTQALTGANVIELPGKGKAGKRNPEA